MNGFITALDQYKAEQNCNHDTTRIKDGPTHTGAKVEVCALCDKFMGYVSYDGGDGA